MSIGDQDPLAGGPVDTRVDPKEAKRQAKKQRQKETDAENIQQLQWFLVVALAAACTYGVITLLPWEPPEAQFNFIMTAGFALFGGLISVVWRLIFKRWPGQDSKQLHDR